MTALYVSLTANVVLLLAALLQRHRARVASIARCADCPLTRIMATPVTARIPVPVYEEPKTLLLLPRTY